MKVWRSLFQVWEKEKIEFILPVSQSWSDTGICYDGRKYGCPKVSSIVEYLKAVVAWKNVKIYISCALKVTLSDVSMPARNVNM